MPTELDVLHGLTFQTTEMVAKLADLARRSKRKGGRASDPIARAALHQLSTALEELRVANEQLQVQVDQLTGAERAVVAARDAVEEFADVLPLATVWTGEAGQIWRINEPAARLLNATKDELLGKSLWFFVADDCGVLAGAIAALDHGLGQLSVDVTVRVKPLGGPPRAVGLIGERLTTSGRYVWFLQP
jgi:PAS domain-containing protein